MAMNVARGWGAAQLAQANIVNFSTEK